MVRNVQRVTIGRWDQKCFNNKILKLAAKLGGPKDLFPQPSNLLASLRFFRPFGGKRQSRALAQKEAKTTYFSFILWRRERTKRHPPPTKPPPIWGVLTEELQKPSILRPFWYRGTRDDFFDGWRMEKNLYNLLPC